MAVAEQIIPLRLLILILSLAAIPAWAGGGPNRGEIEAAFAGRPGAWVQIDGAGAVSQFNSRASAERLPPCSTFKIWNTLIGLETGLVHSPDESFYRWDGKVRFIPDWNKDLTLKEAFQVSCVPAFQDLARKIGPERMKSWIDRLGYGDLDTSAGVDRFWLPEKGRKTVLISAREQAGLIRKLALGELPFSREACRTLRSIMTAGKTGRGTLYGKTGTGKEGVGKDGLGVGWFVGYVEGGGRVHSFACMLRGPNATGKDARALAETILAGQGIL